MYDAANIDDALETELELPELKMNLADSERAKVLSCELPTT